MSENTRAFRKTRVGTVVSDKMDKTIVVAMETSVQHKLYNKIKMCIRDRPQGAHCRPRRRVAAGVGDGGCPRRL